MFDERFVILGALIGLSGALRYAIETLRGTVKPNRVTWLLWTAAPLIAFAAELQEGAGLPALMTFTVGFGPLLVLLASSVQRDASWPVRRFDVVCGLLSVCGLALWALTRTGNVAIAFSILADALAAAPTIVKAYQAPETENAYAFTAMAIGGAITLLTLRGWSFAGYGFPLYILAMSTLLAVLIRRKTLFLLPGGRGLG